MREQASSILAALGGVANIVDIEPCTTRLRSEVRDAALGDVAALRAAGSHGVTIRRTRRAGRRGARRGLPGVRAGRADVTSLSGRHTGVVAGQGGEP